MKKIAFTIVFLLSSILIQAQIAKIVTRVDESGDVASFELDCSVKFPSLAKGLKYNITRHEFKGPELKNTYYLMLVMDGFFTTALNSNMTISAVFTDGTKITERETIEDDGYFDGACTLQIVDPTKRTNSDLKQIIVNTGTKEVVYSISPLKNSEFKKNFKNVIEAK